MITIIDYGMGNLGSIRNIIKKIGHQSEITADKAVINKADKLILPGVGHFDKAMSNLQELGMIELLREKAAAGTPFLGICLGMQLLSNGSEEGVLPGLGIIPGQVKKFDIAPGLKVPHMGWNLVDYKKDNLLYSGFDVFEETRFYFVHSYHFVCDHEENISGTTIYDKPFTSSVQKGNVQGAQFHPEKSHKYGLLLLKNFIEKY